VTPEDVSAPEFWSRRAGRAANDLRELVDVVAAGNPLLLFPEGRPSPDGEIGPLQRGLGALVRRGRPPAVRPIALAYDPLVRGRTRVTLAFGAAVAPPERGVEEWALTLLRRAMPLTCGQLAARRLGEDETVAAIREALDEGRPVEPDLLRAGRRRRRLAEAFAAAAARPADAAFLAREFASARAS
jgi:1-acyl-sn-glycerol-3-phosphate acyltransferase